MILRRTTGISTLSKLNTRFYTNMASFEVKYGNLPEFTKHLKKSTNILALCGAGLSAASGLPTFRGVGGLWRRYDATDLATTEAFARDPVLVWHFYNHRRHMALNAQPNPAHYALAELARRKSNFMTLTQNVDGLSPRAGHPAAKLFELHRSLFEVECSSFCDYREQDNFTDPIVPALALPIRPIPAAPSKTATSGGTTTASNLQSPHGPQVEQRTGEELDISDYRVNLSTVNVDDLPHCPKCGYLLRPGVVWFGEPLPYKVMEEVDAFIDKADNIDLILVIGTSSRVYPAAGYVPTARDKGAKVAVINMDANDVGDSGLVPGDWLFQGDAGVILPEILKGEIGTLPQGMQ